MANLDSEDEILKLDEGKILDSIRKLPEQFAQAWDEVGKISLPAGYNACQNVVICGMGGSALGGRIVDSLSWGRARTPIEIYTEYQIPNYVNEATLVILSSYSGNTEETLSAANFALEKKARIIGITTGGKLAEFLKENKLPAYIFEPKFNPSGQPRMGLAYSIGAILRLLSQFAYIRFADEENEIKETIKKFIREFDADIPSERNLAKLMASKIKGKVPIIFASEQLVGSAHAFSNQLNENAKTFSALFDIPEANHHLMEGLKFPSEAREFLTFLFIKSKLYSPEVEKRYSITKEVIEKNGYPTLTYITSSEDKYCEIFEILVLGSYISFYLAMLEDINPSPIPWVDYFKEKLSK